MIEWLESMVGGGADVETAATVIVCVGSVMILAYLARALGLLLGYIRRK